MALLPSGSGALALQDAGSNPSSNVLLDTGYNSLSLAGDTSFGLFRAYKLLYEGEAGYWEYASDTVADGTAYVYKRSSTSAYHDSGHSTPFNGGFSGFDSLIGRNLHTYMNNNSGTGDGTWASTQLGLNASSASSLGSLGASTFVDYGGTTRQISDIGMVQNTNNDSGAGASQNRANLIWFGIEGNAANDANTFNQITFYDNNGNGITVTRSAADYRYDGTISLWVWENTADNVITFGSHPSGATRVYITSASNITYNNGIAEEFGGNDSSNVHLSHYYKGSNGAFDHATPGIPTSGTLKISDFFGKAFVASTIHSSTMTSYYNTGGGYYIASGYGPLTSGSSVGDNTFNLSNGQAVTWNALYTINSSNMTFTLTSSSNVPNSGWTSIKIYLNQSNASGSPDLTLNRTDASTASGSSTTRSWTWSGTYTYTTYFSATNGAVHFIEIV